MKDHISFQLPQQSLRPLPLNPSLPSRSSNILPLGFDVTKLEEILFHAALIWEVHSTSVQQKSFHQVIKSLMRSHTIS